MTTDLLYDVSEDAMVRFFGFVAGSARYDFGIVFTNQFFGKPLVICMQTGKSTLMSIDDATNLDLIRKTFNIQHEEDALELSTVLQANIPLIHTEPEAEVG
jgi:hypothetical protein